MFRIQGNVITICKLSAGKLQALILLSRQRQAHHSCEVHHSAATTQLYKNLWLIEHFVTSDVCGVTAQVWVPLGAMTACRWRAGLRCHYQVKGAAFSLPQVGRCICRECLTNLCAFAV